MRFDEFLKRRPDVETPAGVVEGVGLDVPMPEQKPAKQELAAEGAKMKRRSDWWTEPNYAQAVEAQRKAAMEAAKRDVHRAKRVRDAALITDMADVLTRMFAQRGGDGAWMMPNVENRAGAANEAYNNALRRKDGLAVDYDGKLFQARMQDYQNKRKQQLADREYELAADKAKRDAEQQAYKAKRDAEQQAYKERLELLKLANDQAEFAYRQKKDEEDRKRAWAKLDNDMKIAGMNNATRMKVQDEITKRAGMYGGGRGYVELFDVGGGNFIELDKRKMTALNKSAIADAIRSAIMEEMSDEEKQTGYFGDKLKKKLGVDKLSDLNYNELYNLRGKYTDYIRKHYGFDDSGEASINQRDDSKKDNSDKDFE